MNREWRKLPDFEAESGDERVMGITRHDAIYYAKRFFAEGMKYVLEHERHSDADGSLEDLANKLSEESEA